MFLIVLISNSDLFNQLLFLPIVKIEDAHA